MKLHRSSPKTNALAELMQAISLLNNQEEFLAFFTDLCTPAELEAMSDRWLVVPLLLKGLPYRSIHEQTGVSVTTITRVARTISLGSGGYSLLAKRVAP